VQSWTVVRDHLDFVAVGNVLSETIGNISQCPSPPNFGPNPGSGDVREIINARNSAQNWFNNILLYPEARESNAVRQFLCYGANVIPPQFEGIGWVTFSPSTNTNEQQNNQRVENSHSGQQQNLELEMDDMFGYEEGVGSQDEEDEDFEDDHDYYSATERYQPTEETMTQDDVMEIQNIADDVEMIEDVGSLAQSLGASHLGRSLQLQAQIANVNQVTKKSGNQNNGIQKGLDIVSSANHPGKGEVVGGIGNAVEQANLYPQKNPRIEGLSDSFNETVPESAPKLNSFKMIKVIGKGSFGKVFLVREIKTDKMFALKVLRKDNIIKRNQVEHTRTERSVLGYVNHPFIVGLKMAFQSKEKLYFVLDYCAGGELFFHLSKVGKFPEPRARFYAAEIVLAIAYVHNLDIIYRDLKPENVLLDARGHVRLTDFGLSKEGISSSSSGATSFCGTPEYLAPEILNRKGHGRAVDWWSLGALLYEMLTGLPPFYCRDRERLFEKIRKGQLDYPRSLSSRSHTLLLGLLTKDPNKRLGSGPKDAEEIKHHIFFSEINWSMLAKGETPPPWDPQIHGSLDTSQFDEEFTNMPIFSPSSYQRPHGFGATPQDNAFEGFTFTDRAFYAPRPES